MRAGNLARAAALGCGLIAAACSHDAVVTQTVEQSSTSTVAMARTPAAPIANRPVSVGRSAPLILPGSGQFLGATSVRDEEGGDGDVSLNFADAEIRDVARSVLGDVLHLNYAIDPKLQATVTVQTSHPLKRDQVLPVFQEVLHMEGLSLVEASGLYRIVPLDQASREATAATVIGRGRGAGIGADVQIVPLKYASAADMRRLLDPVLPKSASVQVDTARNLLIVSGAGQSLGAVTDLVTAFDVNWLSAMSYAIFPLQTGSARAVVGDLESVFGAGGTQPVAGIRFAPLERMNAILVVSPQRAYLDQARRWIERLDRGGEENAPRVFEYHVQNSRAADLAKVLSELLQSGGAVHTVQPQATALQGQSPIAAMVPPAGNNGGGGLPTSGASGINQQTLPTIGDQQSQASNAQQGEASAEAAPSLGAGLGQALNTEGADELEMPKVRIVADEKDNALVIFARPRDYRMIEDAIERLDVVPLQVMIEATIAEVTLTDDLQYGLQWFFTKGNNHFELNSANTGSGTAADIAGSYPGFNYILGGTNTKVVLNALSQLTHVNVVSAPELLVLDHHTAALQVGDQVPVITQTAASTITSNPEVLNSVQYLNTGVILQVTPRVNTSGLVTLDIDQAVSDVSTTTTSSIDSPTITQRRIVTSAVVQDGETIALGGLILQNQSKGRGGIPILSDLPYLGALFGSTNDSTSRTELLVLLTPKIVRNADEARGVTDELRARLRSIRALIDQPS